MYIARLLLFFFFLTSFTTFAQRLNNASMEGEPIDATMPDAWHACEDGTTPDILPGPWGVDTEPFDGMTYVGLITRPNGTWEAIGQQFDQSLQSNACYQMSIVAAHSTTYAGYNHNGRLKVWLGKDKCEKGQLILDVKTLMHADWKEYQIRFTAEKEWKYIILESAHPEGQRASMGNILVDRIRLPYDCERT